MVQLIKALLELPHEVLHIILMMELMGWQSGNISWERVYAPIEEGIERVICFDVMSDTWVGTGGVYTTYTSDDVDDFMFSDPIISRVIHI